MNNNKLLIAVAGAGKTTFLINEAIKRHGAVLITTYTKSNEFEIKNKIYRKLGYIPSNIEIESWFEFLLRQGVRPFQGVMHNSLYEERTGFVLTNKKSAPYTKESDILKHYFTKELKIYSDKVSKFTVKCNEKMNGKVIDRISRIYSHIFIDEIQDMVGYDLELLKRLFDSSSEVIIVGDPRQTTFATHPTGKYNQYKNGNIEEFILQEAGFQKCEIDKCTLKTSHRNDEKICAYSSRLYPSFPKSISCNCVICRNYTKEHTGVFLIKKEDVPDYMTKYKPTQLRWDKNVVCHPGSTVYNFGDSKGMTFDRVLIYPTEKIASWIKDNTVKLEELTKAKFYVALTRARQSVAIVMGYDEKHTIDGVEYYAA
ncbi:MAG: UvrD-helicase domain-containing protein [Spirochaetaceae bacterium]|nr:UvrD-helicase domain-containing protein [Spirochaetaceae bacterium]